MASRRDPQGLYGTSGDGELCRPFAIDIQRAADPALAVASLRAKSERMSTALRGSLPRPRQRLIHMEF